MTAEAMTMSREQRSQQQRTQQQVPATPQAPKSKKPPVPVKEPEPERESEPELEPELVGAGLMLRSGGGDTHRLRSCSGELVRVAMSSPWFLGHTP